MAGSAWADQPLDLTAGLMQLRGRGFSAAVRREFSKTTTLAILTMSELHFVKVTFAPLTEAEIDVLLGEDARLDVLFGDRSVVDYDGFDRGDDDFCMYFYGTNADSMATLIVRELKGIPVAARGIVLKRYGEREDAREETTSLR